MKTFKLNNGLEVLAKDDGYPYTYSNRTQAIARVQKMLDEFGAQFGIPGEFADVWIYQRDNSPFYIALNRKS